MVGWGPDPKSLKSRAKQFPFSKRRTNNFPFQTVREEGSQLYWTAHKPNWSPTSSLFSQEYIFCLIRRSSGSSNMHLASV